MRFSSAALGICIGVAMIGVGAACGSSYAEATPDASAPEAAAGDGPGAVGDSSPVDDANASDGPITTTALASGYTDLAGIAATDTTVYFIERSKGLLHSVPITGGTVSDIFDSKAAPSALVLSGDDLFWTDYGHLTLNRFALLNGANEAVTPVTKAPAAIAIGGGRLVVASIGAGDVGEVQQYQLDLNAGPSIGALQNPYDVAAYGNNFYWTESGAATIGMGTIGANDMTSVASAESGCESIAADAEGVYWTRPGAGLVRALSGVAVKTLASGQMAPFAIAADASGVYWLTTDGKVRRSTRSELPIETVASGFAAAFGAKGHLRGLALTSKHVVWLTSDGRVLRADK